MPWEHVMTCLTGDVRTRVSSYMFCFQEKLNCQFSALIPTLQDVLKVCFFNLSRTFECKEDARKHSNFCRSIFFKK